MAFPSAGAAEEFEATHCFAGAFTAFHGSQDLMAVLSYAQDGIVRSSNKLFNNVATHVAGVVRGGGPTAEGYFLYKLVDADGDIIIAGGPYVGLKYRFPFLEGTGKWKGITGGVVCAIRRACLARRRPKPSIPVSLPSLAEVLR